MSDHERTSLEDSVLVIQTKLAEREDAQKNQTTWIQVLVGAFIMQAIFTIFMSGVKWNQVDRLIQDVAHLEVTVRQIELLK